MGVSVSDTELTMADVQTQAQILTLDDTLTGGDVLPGFSTKISAFFDD
jgi:hypothetical protein